MKDFSGAHTIKNESTGQYLEHDGEKVTLSSRSSPWYLVAGTDGAYRFQTGKGDDAPVLRLKGGGEQNNSLQLGPFKNDADLWEIKNKNDTTGMILSSPGSPGGQNEISVQDGKLKLTHEDKTGKGRRPSLDKVPKIYMWIFGSPSRKK